MNQRKAPKRLAALAAAALLCLQPLAADAFQRRPRPETRAPQPRRAEPDRPFEELLPADGYGVYFELRRLGEIFETTEIKSSLAALSLISDDAGTFAEVAAFFAEHKELLADARLSVAFMPTRGGLPDFVGALQLASPEEAAGFEAKYRAFVTDGARTLAGPQPTPEPRRRTRRAAPRAKPAPPVVVRRVGSLLVTSGQQFTPNRLRPRGAASLAESARFQSLRQRFATENLFVYLDVERAQEGWTYMAQREAEERERAERASGQKVPAPPLTVGTPDEAVTPDEEAAAAAPSPETEAPAAPPATENEDEAARAEPSPEPAAEPTPGVETEGEPAEVLTAPAPPSEERLAAAGMERLMRNLWGGVPRLPAAAALAIGLEGETVSLRVAVEREGGPVNLVPFLPNLVSGPPVTTEAAQVAPADGGIFFSASLDWARIFDALLGTAKEAARETEARLEENPEAMLADAGDDGKVASADETLAAVEKFFGFKIREDFLPTLGGEVAFSLPLDEIMRGYRLNPEGPRGEVEAEPGLVVLVALSDAEKAARLLPRVLTIFGLAPPGAPAATERREGVEIRQTGGFAYAVVNNFLVLGELQHVRHAVTESAAHRTLASAPGYRAATGWQAKQRLVQGYLSEELMRRTAEDTRRMSAGSTDPLVLAMLSQLDLEPEAASLSSTDEGEFLIHELRLPVNLIKLFGASSAISLKEAPVIGNEMTAGFILSSVRDAQNVFRGKEGRDRFGTLEELIAEDLLEKGLIEQKGEYALELTALGDRYEVTATPRQYGKTGRRSFFLDETGVIRAADHKGKPATAQDPPVD